MDPTDCSLVTCPDECVYLVDESVGAPGDGSTGAAALADVSSGIAAAAADLPPEVVQAAEERGRALDWNETVAQLWAEFEAEAGDSYVLSAFVKHGTVALEETEYVEVFVPPRAPDDPGPEPREDASETTY